jgi:hypothetical protein
MFRVTFNAPTLLLKVAIRSGLSKQVFGLSKLAKTFWMIMCVLRTSHLETQVPKNHPKSSICFVLGNGPSLKTDIDRQLDLLQQGEVFCVNDFAKSELYALIQPNYYVIADPASWNNVNSDRADRLRAELYEQIISKTFWPLKIFVPFQAKNFFEAIFSTSKNITLICFNSTSLNDDVSIAHLLYDLGVCMPRVQNVLIAALYLTLRIGYKKVILLGADHSWHQTLELDSENRVCIRNLYFNTHEAALKPWFKDYDEVDIWNMPDIFHALAAMFDGYCKLEKYAGHHGAQIYNASSVTFIDAFQRMPIKDAVIKLTNN